MEIFGREPTKMTHTEPETTEEQKINENAIDITPDQDAGVVKEILRRGEGDGSPCPGDSVFVHYVGTLTDGSKFDSSRDRGEEFEFKLGTGKVIKAWDIGVATMKKGELAKFTCNSKYAYGETGSPPKIPPNATLIFEIELFNWKGEDVTTDKDGGIIKHMLQKGEGHQTPNDGATVNIHYKGRYNGQLFEERDVQFVVGEGSENGIIDGLEVAVQSLKKNEEARFDICPEYGYGNEGKTEFNIPAGATLEYDVQMKSFEKAKESWDMDIKEKLEQSEIIKAKGTTFFKAQKFKQAINSYSKITSYLEYETSLEDDHQKQRDVLMLAAHLNLAMCYLKTEENLKVEEQCDKALELDSGNTKAFFRRGQAKESRKDFELAKEDFEVVLKIEPDNKAAKNHILLCNQKIKQFNEKQKKIYAGMFTKFAEQDLKNMPQKVKMNKDDVEADELGETPDETPSSSNGDDTSASKSESTINTNAAIQQMETN